MKETIAINANTLSGKYPEHILPSLKNLIDQGYQLVCIVDDSNNQIPSESIRSLYPDVFTHVCVCTKNVYCPAVTLAAQLLIDSDHKHCQIANTHETRSTPAILFGHQPTSVSAPHRTIRALGWKTAAEEVRYALTL